MINEALFISRFSSFEGRWLWKLMLGLDFNSSPREGNPLTNTTGSFHESSCSSNKFSKMVRWGSGPERIISIYVEPASFEDAKREMGPRYFRGAAGRRMGWESSPARLLPFSSSGTQHSVKRLIYR